MTKVEKKRDDPDLLSDYKPIDEFAAATGLSTRTIRYYQSRGLLERPTRRGRLALYGPPHRERIELIEEMQSRGLTLRGIKDLVRGQDNGNAPLEAWLDLDRMRGRWTIDPPKLMSRAELEAMVGDGGSRQISRLLDLGAIQLDDQDGLRRYRVNPTLITCALQLEQGGISLEVSTKVHALIESHFVSAAGEVIDFLYKSRGKGFGDSDMPDDVARAIEAIFPASGSPFVQTIFAQAVDRALGEWLEADGPKKIAKKARKPKENRVKRTERRRARRKGE